MKQILIVLIAFLVLSIPGHAQQDPNDPGMQDSLIISSVSVDSGQTFVFLQLMAVTDDSVTYYDFPFTIRAPLDGVCFSAGTLYFPPLTSWDDIYDTVSCNPPYYRQIGWADFGHINLPIYTDSIRRVISTIRLVINPLGPPQTAIVDTFSTCFFGANNVGFIPAFVPGIVFVGAPQGISNDDRVPHSISLAQNYPNPFNSSTEIEFSLPQSGSVSLVIYDIQGREIRRLINDNIGSGSQKIIWDGTDNNNVDVASGIYFYRLTSGDSAKINRMTLLR